MPRVAAFWPDQSYAINIVGEDNTISRNNRARQLQRSPVTAQWKFKRDAQSAPLRTQLLVSTNLCHATRVTVVILCTTGIHELLSCHFSGLMPSDLSSQNSISCIV